MKLGYPTHPRRDVLDEIRWIADQGFDFVDLFLEPDRGDLCIVDAAAIKALLAERKLGVVGHTAWYLPIGSPLEQLRSAAVQVAQRYLEVFAAIECKKVTIHAHWPPSLFTDEEGIAFQTESLRHIIGLASNLGIGIIYEPVGMHQESVENLTRILRLNPEMGFHLDIGHFNLNGRWPGDFAKAFADRLEHVHLHDNDGRSDLHLPPGAGKIDWNRLIPELKSVYDGTITLEVFSHEREYITLARRLILERWNRASEPAEPPKPPAKKAPPRTPRWGR